MMRIKSVEQLREIYSLPKGRALAKQISQLETHSRNFIEKSPFLVLSTVNKSGKVDASPRGGKSGFVKVLNDNRIIIPDASGNNRLDSIQNIIEQGQIGLLLLIPGVDETLRINGKACIRVDSSLLALFDNEPKKPISVIDISVEEVFLHCAKSLMRSRLWAEDSKIIRQDFPSMGQMLKDQIGGAEPVESHQDMVKRYLRDIE